MNYFPPPDLLLTGSQISVINDMTAIPTYMAQSLSTAKGTWGHAAAQSIKGAAYGAVNLASQGSDNKS